MELMVSINVIVGVCGVVLAIHLMRRSAAFLLGFIARMCLGIIEILLINRVLAGAGIAVMVGINPLTLLTSGILGFAGVGLLFAIAATKFL